MELLPLSFVLCLELPPPFSPGKPHESSKTHCRSPLPSPPLLLLPNHSPAQAPSGRVCLLHLTVSPVRAQAPSRSPGHSAPPQTGPGALRVLMCPDGVTVGPHSPPPGPREWPPCDALRELQACKGAICTAAFMNPERRINRCLSDGDFSCPSRCIFFLFLVNF